MCYEWDIWEDTPEKAREPAKPVTKKQTAAPQPPPAPAETAKPAPVETELEPA
jgi:hypothetical protein